VSVIDRVLAAVAPETALRRAQARAALSALMHYDAANANSRNAGRRLSRSDADTAAARRSQLSALARDLIRNTPQAARAQQVIAANVVADGIIPKVETADADLRARLQALVTQHLDTTAIDADGRANLYGLQRLACAAMVDAGEVLVRRRRRRVEDRLPLPFQLQVLEADYIDTSREGATPTGYIREGIEYDLVGRRSAYYLYEEHPGSSTLRPRNLSSRRVPAAEVVHLYRQDRPGQMRGVSWFAPVALSLMDLHDWQDAQLVRQKIAACFVAFVKADGMPGDALKEMQLDETLSPGRIQRLRDGEEVQFGTPPSAEGGEFVTQVERAIAAGLGITYEALTGNLRGVNFSSGRMGRLEMIRNITAWQNLTVIPQMLDPIGSWFVEAAGIQLSRQMPADLRMTWVPPRPALVNPVEEIRAIVDGCRAGLMSRQHGIRELGYDPEAVLAEQIEDARTADANGLIWDTDPRRTSAAGLTQARPAAAAAAQTEDEETTGDAA
jgi:lambda family phage portal protein